MADQAFTSMDQNSMTSPSQGFDKTTGAAKSVADQALSAGRDLKERAMDVAGASSEAIKDKASDFVDAAKDVASQASGKLRQTVEGQKNVGAEYVGTLADTMRRAAREFDNDLPIAGTYIRKAASQIEGVSDSIKNGDFEDLIRGAQDFARRQPTAFLGLAVLAGFGLVRFLKSSAPASSGASEMGEGSYMGHGAHMSGGTGMGGEGRGRQAINEGYRDGFTN